MGHLYSYGCTAGGSSSRPWGPGRPVTVARWTYVKHAADLYAQGWTLRQIGAELGVHWSTVSDQLRRAGSLCVSGDPPLIPASTQQIVELREQGLTWN